MTLALGTSAADLRVGSSAISKMVRGSTAFWDADAADYVARVQAADGEPLELGVASAYHAFCLGCKTDGIWDALQACCIMAGARTIEGALVPLKTPYGTELANIAALPTPTITDSGGSTGVWTPATRTMSSSTTGTSDTFPRFAFPVGMTVGKRYKVTLTLSLAEPGCLTYVRIGGATLIGGQSAVDSFVVDGIYTCTGTSNFQIDLDATAPGAAVTIESLSIREDSFTPTPVNLVSGDYSRSGTLGIKGDGTTKHIDSSRRSDSDPSDDCHLAVYATEAQSGAVRMYAGGQSSHPYDIYRSVDDLYLRNGVTSAAFGEGAASGFLGHSRSDASEWTRRSSGATTTVAGGPRIADPVNLYVLARNGPGGTDFRGDARVAFYSIGESLNLALLDARVSALMTAIGAAL